MNEDKIKEFVSYVSTFRSKGTANIYEGQLNSFFEFIKKDYNKVKISDITAYVQHKSSDIAKDSKGWEKVRKEWSNNTKNTFLSVMISFYKFHKQFNLAEDLTHLRIKKSHMTHIPVHLTMGELKKMLNTRLYNDSELEIRNNLLILFLYATGLRRSEVANFKVEQFDVGLKEDQLIEITGKGNKPRYIKIPGWWIKNYNENYYSIYQRSQVPYLFVSKRSLRLGEHAIWDIIKKKARIAGIRYDESYVSPHKLRSTFATELYENGADLLTMQQLLGHGDPSTTAIYTKVNKDKLLHAKTPEMK